MPKRKYRAVNPPRTLWVVDPPWDYRTWSKKNQTRNADQHYDCMTNQELLDLAPLIKEAAGPESIMGMWCTASNLPFALELLEAWGYKFKTVLFTWIKLNKLFKKELLREAKTFDMLPPNEGMALEFLESLCFKSLGHWTRSNAEFMIVGKRGKEPINRLRKDIPQLILAPIGEHSEKPAEANRRFEALLRRPQDPPPIELFARRQYSDWYCTGLDYDGLDVRFSLENIYKHYHSNEPYGPEFVDKSVPVSVFTQEALL